ncbi:MAG: sigma-70 family RNA polymerase sigma factor [bacterium]
MSNAADVELMRALHDEHAAALWSFALRLTSGDRTRAEDVVQETLLRAWRTPKVLDQSTRSARSWLFTVAKRIVIDEWRSPRTARELAMAEPPERAVPDEIDQALDAWLIAEALGRLTPDHRAVLVECFYRGSSTAEAARALDIAEGTVKSRTHYALRALRLSFQELGVER